MTETIIIRINRVRNGYLVDTARDGEQFVARDIGEAREIAQEQFERMLREAADALMPIGAAALAPGQDVTGIGTIGDLYAEARAAWPAAASETFAPRTLFQRQRPPEPLFVQGGIGRPQSDPGDETKAD